MMAWFVRPVVFMCCLVYCQPDVPERKQEFEKLEKELEMKDKIKEAEEEGMESQYVPLSGPTIDIAMSPNVTAILGASAILNCRIHYVVARVVTWSRSRDKRVLTVGQFTFTNDERYKSLHQKGSEDWILKIHYVQKRDIGAYECQVAIEPPIIHTIWLDVVETTTTILGGPDVFVSAGSSINLTCVVENSIQNNPFIFWYHDNVFIDLSFQEKGFIKNRTISMLLPHGRPKAAKLYLAGPNAECNYKLSNHLTNREELAAISHKNKTASGGAISLLLLTALLVLLPSLYCVPRT
ncbi:unnamed protein product, partial [Meganyctiphanes norvegica]